MLRKFAVTEILSATMAPVNDPLGLARYAHRHQFSYEPRPGYLYVRSRAISSRTNDNFDTFPAEEIKASYASFVGKPVFINHNNDNHKRARGVCIDAALHEDRNPDGSPDTWAEVLMEVDAVRFPKLAEAILAGHIDRTSMGTDVAYSLCSFCGNKATTPLEYCDHIPKLKGKRIYRTTASGTKEGVLVSEICHGLKFFENSLLVEEPADPTAFFLGVEGHGVSKTASSYDPELAARQRARWDQQRSFRDQGLCDCDGSLKIERHKAGEHSNWAKQNEAAGKTDGWGTPIHQPYDGHGAFNCNNRSCAEHPQSLYDTPENREPTRGRGTDRSVAPSLVQGMPGWMQHDLHPDKEMHREIGRVFHEKGLDEDGRYLLDQQHDGPSKFSRRTAAADPSAPDYNKHYHRGWTAGGRGGDALDRADSRGEHEAWYDGYYDQAAGRPKWHSRDNRDEHGYPITSAKTASDESIHLPEHVRQQIADASSAGQMAAEMRDHGDQRTVNLADPHDLHSHLEHHGYQAFDGHFWRNSEDPNHPALDEGDDVDRPLHPHEMRRLHDWEHAHGMANEHPDYNGGTPGHFMGDSHFHTAMRWTASRVYASGPPEGGVHDGHQVRAYPVSGSSGFIIGHRYECDGCRDGYTAGAARHWTPPGTKCENHNHDVNMGKIQSGDKGGAYSEYEQFSHDPAVAGWDTHKGVACQDCAANMKPNSDRHHEWSAIPKHLVSPQDDCATCGKSLIMKALSSLTPSLAYGEQTAPADVDTLRDEECPVCAEADAYDGNECQVCGFIAPPKMFMDPDLDVAKQQDLRGEMQQEMMSDPNGDGMPDVIPGSGNPGTDAPPMDPEQVPDPDDVAQQQVNEIVDGQQPLQPEQLDENGQPVVDANPIDQDMPADPNAAQMQEGDVAGDAGQGQPGTPGDGVTDLGCPACGYTVDATAPESVDMDTPTAQPGEVAEGAMCPNCGQGALTSLKDVQEAVNQTVHASLFPVIRL